LVSFFRLVIQLTHHYTLFSYSIHSNKENDGTAPPRRRRSTAGNPYVTRKKVPTAFSTTLSQAPLLSLATIEEEEETSPIIRQILQQTGCSNRQELLAKRAAQEANTNRSKSAPNGLKAATNGSKSTNSNVSANPNGSKAKAAPNGSMNPAKTATNAAKVSKSSNGRKATTNPKMKAKSKYFY